MPETDNGGRGPAALQTIQPCAVDGSMGKLPAANCEVTSRVSRCRSRPKRLRCSYGDQRGTFLRLSQSGPFLDQDEDTGSNQQKSGSSLGPFASLVCEPRPNAHTDLGSRERLHADQDCQ